MSLKPDDPGSISEQNRSLDPRPLYVFFGFLLLGGALALVIFGGNLLNSSASEITEDSTQTLLDQVSDLSELGVNPIDPSVSTGFVETDDRAPEFHVG